MKDKPVIGFFIHDFMLTYSFNLWSGIKKGIQERNGNIISFAGGEYKSKNILDYPKNILYKLVSNNTVDGIIVVSSIIFNSVSDNEIYDFTSSFHSIPIVSIGCKIKDIPSILIDNKKGLEDELDHLITHHGYKNISFIRGPALNQEAEERYSVYRNILKKHNLIENPEIVGFGNFHINGAKKVMIDILNKNEKIDAIVAANDDMALGIMDVLLDRGIKVPYDIAVCGFDDIDDARFSMIPLTTVHQPINEQGRKAVNLIFDIIEGKNTEKEIILPTKNIIRKSCGCLNINYNKFSQNEVVYNHSTKKNNKEEFITFINKKLKDKNLLINSNWTKNFIDLSIKSIKENEFTQLLNFFDYFLFNSIINNKWDVDFWYEIINDCQYFFNSYFHNKNEVENINELINFSNNLIKRMHHQFEISTSSKDHSKAITIRSISYSLIRNFDFKSLFKTIGTYFPLLKIKKCFLSLFDKVNKDFKNLKLVYAYDENGDIKLPSNGLKYKSEEIISKKIFNWNNTQNLNVELLVYQDEIFGLIVFDIDEPKDAILETLKQQISSALKGTILIKHEKEQTKKLNQAKKSLEFSNLKLTQLDDLKNDFIANITHDFRSPLSVILNTADICLRYDDKSNIELINNRLTTIINASLKLKLVIDRLLDLAKMDAQGLKLKIKKVKIRNFILSIADFYKSTVTSSSINIIDILPPHEIDNFYTDPDRLEEIISNLLSNAIKYVNNENGEILISLINKKESINIIIEDNGIGIPPDKLSVIFNRFEQIESGENNFYKGSGIGLAFAKQLTEYLKGSITAESEGIGKGTKFILEFPKGKMVFKNDSLYEFQKEENEINFSNRSEMSKFITTEIKEKIKKDIKGNEPECFIEDINEISQFDFQKGIILIVEDNIDIREIEKTYLKNSGYCNFILAADGKVGIDAAYLYRPDLIICDYNMPNMRGDEFQDELINNPDFKHIPFIFISAVIDKGIITERKRKGAVAFLGKPIDEMELVTTVDVHMKKYMEYKSIYRQATLDELTKINNRRNLMKLLNQRLAIRKLNHLSIIFFDVDHFKNFNDNYGHQTGDKILHKIGNVINNVIRPYDIAGRYGGEEFMVILPDTNIDQAEIVAKKIKKEIKNIKIKYKNKILHISASFGISSLIDNEAVICKNLNMNNLEEIYEIKKIKNALWNNIEKLKENIGKLLIEFADQALYLAKSTICKQCNYKSEKYRLFIDNKCPECGSLELELGRDKIVKFR